ncbi:MAG: acetyl ornithine aminotransferase family protein [Thermoplasmatota archaeon]
MRPTLRTAIPGPNATTLVARDAKVLATTTKTAPFAAARGEGVWVEDVDGNRILDFTSGVGVTNVGYGNARVLAAIQAQAKNLIHFAGTDYYYESQVTYAERLAPLTPVPGPQKVFYTNSGTESNEAGIKLARHHTKRPQFLAFLGAFHGRSMGSLALNASKRVHREGYFPMMPGVVHVPYANPFRNPWHIDGYAHPDELVGAVLEYLDAYVCDALLPPSEIAAIVVEPVQGEGGYIVPPPTFLPRLAKWAHEKGALVILDEVQSGFGRTGKLFAAEHSGVRPDAIALAKAMANGIPMGALVFRADLDWSTSGSHSNTFGGNALASAAAIATLDALTQDRLVENAAKMGDHLKRRLAEGAAKDTRIGDVRGLGLMLATEFVKPGTKDPDPTTRNRVTEEALRRGLLLLPCGKSSLRFIPPLCITKEEADAGADIFAETLAATHAHA